MGRELRDGKAARNAPLSALGSRFFNHGEVTEGSAFVTANTQIKETGYAPVNGLKMYYEVHGTGDAVPLVLIHGAFMLAETMGPLVTALADNRRVIVPEMQGHGRTNDADRPLTHQQMADDTAGLLRHLGIERADVAGYSLGGGVAWQVAIRHPELVRKLVPISVVTDTVKGAVPEYPRQ